MLSNKIVNGLFSLLERAPWIGRAIMSVPPLAQLVNRWIVNSAAAAVPPRPLPYSLWSPDPKTDAEKAIYTTWPGLTDRSFTGRHLAPMDADEVERLPCVDALKDLFKRERFEPSRTTSVLFCLFAQWFTDSFLRTAAPDARRNTSNHEIDLCQIYGLGEHSTRLLRQPQGGLLKSRMVDGAEYPALLADETTLEVKPEFAGVAYDPLGAMGYFTDPPNGATAKTLRDTIKTKIGDWASADDRWSCFHAAGLERAGSTIVYSALNTVFLREHNRLARALATAHPDWGDDRLFETARNINIVLLLKIIIEDYINHLASIPLTISFDQGFADTRPWYRTNRISLEFNLLYRWHAMVPDRFRLAGEDLAPTDFRFNNALLEQVGVEQVLEAASGQPAGRLGLHNTPEFLLEADVATVRLGRRYRLKGFNDYRRRWGLDRYRSFEELTGGNLALAAELRALYPDQAGKKGIDRLELFVGLLAEQRRASAVLPELMKVMVASDAFSQALTNPLLAGYVYRPECFGSIGMAAIRRTRSFRDLVWRNLPPGAPKPDIRFSLATPR